jgi:hypothetical protein
MHAHTSNQPQDNPTQRCAVTQQPQRDAVHPRTRDDANPQSQYCGTAPYSLRSTQCRRCTPKTRILHRVHDAATILHIFAGPTRTSRTCRPAPRSPLPSHHAHTRAQTHTTRQAPPSTTARRRRGAYHPKQRTPTSHARHSAHSHATHKHTSPHTRRTSRTAATTALCANHHCTHAAAPTPHTQHSPLTQRTQRYQRGIRALAHGAGIRRASVQTVQPIDAIIAHIRERCQAAEAVRNAAG